MAETYKRLAAGQFAATSTTIYTAPALTKCLSPSIRLFNTGGSIETVKIRLDDGTSRQFWQVDIPASGSAQIDLDKVVLEAGHIIRAQTTTGATVNFWLSGVESA